MAVMKLKLAIGSAILVAAITYLASAGVKSGWVYFLEVDKFLADSQYQGQRVRLHGKVADEGFSVSSPAMTASFHLLGKSKKLAVVYHGSIPDMFQAGRDVVVEGKCDANGKFMADVLMTKCASKYEGSPHGAAGKAGQPS